MRISVVLIILLLLGQTAGALTREDFAAGFALQFQPAGAVHGLLLPEKIYTTVVHADLADVRVFNGDGNVVPHLLRIEQQEPPQIVRQDDVPFSPLYDPVPGGTVRQIETRIARGAEGAGKAPVAITQSIRDKKEATRQLSGYLLDMSAITVDPFRLQFKVGGESDFLATVTLEGSDDLTDWSYINRETLARLNYQGHRLEKNAEILIRGGKRYIRLSWPAGTQSLRIDGIRAVSYSSVQPPVRNWTALPPVLPEKQLAAGRIVLEYDSKGFLQVDTIRVGLAGGNNLIQGVIKSRPDREAGWRIRGQGTFYRLQQQGVALRHDTLSVPMTTDRYWQLEIAAEDGAFSRDVLPQLELGWRPHTLYFLDQGEGPYILAFGNGRMGSVSGSPENGLKDLLQDIAQQKTIIQTALIGKEITLGGPQMLIALPPPPPWKKWLLWGVLISGVLLIGGMAYSLYCQMRSARVADKADKGA
ncbi:MAG: DUF3999 domain-containing protein [Desulfurivibrio sp.]|nr:MAG: DUF3999 domain-containing protein [Desulfurivibrio sp.]